MAKPNAYVLRLDKARAEVFADALNESGFFAEAVPSFSHSRNVPLVCFIVGSQGRITHIASGRRGVNAGTQQSRLNVNDVEPLKTRLTVQKVINGVPARNRKVVADRFRNGGLLTPKASASPRKQRSQSTASQRPREIGCPGSAMRREKVWGSRRKPWRQRWRLPG